MRLFINSTNSLTAIRKKDNIYEYYSKSYKSWRLCTNHITTHSIYIGKSDYWRRVSIKTYYDML